MEQTYKEKVLAIDKEMTDAIRDAGERGVLNEEMLEQIQARARFRYAEAYRATIENDLPVYPTAQTRLERGEI